MKRRYLSQEKILLVTKTTAGSLHGLKNRPYEVKMQKNKKMMKLVTILKTKSLNTTTLRRTLTRCLAK